MGHIGFTPQSEHQLGGYRVQGHGRTAEQVVADAHAVAEAGAFAVVLEMVPGVVAKQITAELEIPTIGIGAGPECDAQVLVWQDMLGLREGKLPRFVKQYAELADVIRAATSTYVAEVVDGSYPGEEHTFEMKPRPRNHWDRGLACWSRARSRSSRSTEVSRRTVSAPHARIGFVATMGALHAGHDRSIKLARSVCDVVVVSIFVNPLQFGPGEDYARYPRPLEDDLAVCRRRGVDLVLAPSVADLYPAGRQVSVAAGPLGTVFEGAARPGHFDGVLTVVLKLLHIVDPDVAIFGQKDAQQLACVRRMVADLNLDVDIVGAPIIREPDGLALSSRNRFLTAADRPAALALSAALLAAAAESLPELRPGGGRQGVGGGRRFRTRPRLPGPRQSLHAGRDRRRAPRTGDA